MRRTALLALSLLLLVAAGSYVYHQSGQAAIVPPSDTVAPAPEKAHLIHGVGYVEPVSQVRRLVFRTGGVIERCSVQPGSVVKAGQVLMALYDGEPRTNLALAESALASARADRARLLAGAHPRQLEIATCQVSACQALLRIAQREHARTQSLRTSGAAAANEDEKAADELARTEAACEAAQAEVKHLKEIVRLEDKAVADAKVAEAEGAVARAREQLAQAQLLAPADGTVLEVLKHEGEGFSPLTNEPVLVFADLSSLQIRTEVDERYVSQLRAGQRVQISGRALGDATYAGTVTAVRSIMGKKTVFTHSADERKDLEVVQLIVAVQQPFMAPIGLEVDVAVDPRRPG